jgi:hypothetical protein
MGPSPLRLLLFGCAGLFGLAALAGAAWLVMLVFSGGPNVAVSLSPDGTQLTVELPDEPDQTVVRYGDRTAEVRDGAARLTVPLDATHVGDNTLALELQRPGSGGAVGIEVDVRVDARVVVDPAPLAEGPFVDLAFEAIDGAAIRVGDAAVALEDGMGTHRLRLPPEAFSNGRVVFRSSYRVEAPDAEPVDVPLPIDLALASLRLETPSAGAVTAEASFPVRGLVAPGTAVTVGGEAVSPGADGRFVADAALPSAGTHPVVVVATQEGRAPHRLEVPVERVASEAAARERFRQRIGDAPPTWAQLSSDEANALRGRRVAFSGDVYHVDRRADQTVVQMVVTPASACPREGAQCPLWVVLPSTVEVSRSGGVEVLGTADGRQRFLTNDGQVHTVPRILGRFVERRSGS